MRATIIQLAAFAGKSERTVRRYLASGKWPHTVLPGGLIEIDDSLIEPESEQGAIMAALARIEAKLDKLSASVDSLPAQPPQVTHHARMTANLPPGPAQGELPPGLTPWRDYAKQHGYSETTVQKYIDAGQVPVIAGRWKRGHAIIKACVDEEGMRAMDALFSGQ